MKNIDPPKCIIPKTSVKIDNARFNIPFIFDTDCVPFDAGNAWLIHLATNSLSKPNTVERYAHTVVSLLKHVAAERSSKSGTSGWQDITNAMLRRWRNRIERDSQSDTAGYNVRIAFRFLSWAADMGYLQVPVNLDAGVASEAGTISVKEVSTQKVYKQFLPVPSTADLVKVQHVISAHGGRLVERNMLMFLWAKESGLRNSEIRNLRCADLPSSATLRRWAKEGVTPKLPVLGKGGKLRTVEPPPGLISRTLEFVAARDSAASSLFVFVTGKGQPPTGEWISNLYSGYFRIAGIQGTLHRARAYYLYSIVFAKIRELAVNGNLDQFHVSTVIAFTLGVAGHESIEVLKHYINLAAVAQNMPAPGRSEDKAFG